MKKVFIVEQDVNTINLIEEVLGDFQDIEISGSSSQPNNNALNQLLSQPVDVVFLNMDAPVRLEGFLFDMAQLAQTPPAYIALSSSKERAYDAYQFHCFDFVLKPLTGFGIKKSMSKYLKQHPEQAQETICLKSNKDYQYLSLPDVLFLKADNNTTDFYMKDGSMVSAYKTLKIFEKTLPGNFFRIHKSYIVNAANVSRIHYGKGICVVKTRNDKIPFTKTFIDNINTINNSLYSQAIMV